MGSLHSHAQSMRRSGRAVDNGQRRCVEELLDVAQGCGAGAKGQGARRTLLVDCPRRHHPARNRRGSRGQRDHLVGCISRRRWGFCEVRSAPFLRPAFCSRHQSPRAVCSCARFQRLNSAAWAILNRTTKSFFGGTCNNCVLFKLFSMNCVCICWF